MPCDRTDVKCNHHRMYILYSVTAVLSIEGRKSTKTFTPSFAAEAK